LVATHNFTREEIREAYIAPLRSAVLVDDAFPRYEELLGLVGSNQQAPAYEYDAAKRVVSMCHNRSLICDIENRPTEKLTAEELRRITKADLVILDYHLSSDETDVRPALSILQTLAESDHANLVVIYTKHELKTAQRDVFIRCRGIDKTADFPAEYDATDLTEWKPAFDADRLFAYLRDRKGLRDLIDSVSTELQALGVKRQDLATVTKTGVELWLQANYKHVDAPQRAEDVVARSADTDATPWVHFKNVFVAFVSKTDTNTDVIDALETALTDWNPGVLRLVLSNARNRMLRRGFAYEKIVAGSPERQIGLLFHALGGEEPDAAVRLQDMLRRLFDSARRELAADSAEFGARLIKRHMDTAAAAPAEDDTRTRFYIDHARAMAHVESTGTDAQVIGALNAFLCSRPFDGSHLFAGTVFRDSEALTWWLCAAPSCEIVPREPADRTWQADIHPSMPMQALRLEQASSLETALAKATEAKHIFVQFEGGTVALRVLEPGSSQPRPEMLILHEGGRIEPDGTFKAHAIVKGPELKLKTFQIVAQLRNEYADRFLHQTGHHVSRIGVDFVPFRTTPS
jgi:hypothetical protein